MDIIFTSNDETYILSALQKLFEFPLRDVNQIRHGDNFMLHEACWNGWIKIVQLFMDDERTNLNQLSRHIVSPYGTENQTTFMIACQSGHFDIVELLLNDERVDCNKGSKTTTALILSMEFGNQRIFNYLLESDKINHSQKTDDRLFYRACVNGRIDCLKTLLEEGFLNKQSCDPNKKVGNDTALSMASGSGHFDMVVFLINEFGEDSSQLSEFILYDACQKNDLNAVKSILNDNNFYPNKKSSKTCSGDYRSIATTALSIAGWKNHADIVHHLLETYPDIEIPIFKMRWPKEVEQVINLHMGGVGSLTKMRKENFA